MVETWRNGARLLRKLETLEFDGTGTVGRPEFTHGNGTRRLLEVATVVAAETGNHCRWFRSFTGFLLISLNPSLFGLSTAIDSTSSTTLSRLGMWVQALNVGRPRSVVRNLQFDPGSHSSTCLMI